MKALFLTADKIGAQTGGGCVTYHELLALQGLADVTVFQPADQRNPFAQDANVLAQIKDWWPSQEEKPALAHCYAGCLSGTVEFLKDRGCKVTYTVAAHNLPESKKEHGLLGLRFDYPHLNDERQFIRYTLGYMAADRIVVPSSHSEEFMRSTGARRLVLIPHGCPETVPDIAPYPNRFSVGYLGAAGADKGLKYLVEAWKQLDYKNATLFIAGRESTSPWVYHLLTKYGGGLVQLLGWVDDVKDFYSQVSLYVQPSVTEGFGLEVLEAMHHGRPVLCSIGAGAHDAVPDLWKFYPRDVKELVHKIDAARSTVEGKDAKTWGKIWQEKCVPYGWDKIRARYQQMWKGLV